MLGSDEKEKSYKTLRMTDKQKQQFLAQLDSYRQQADNSEQRSNDRQDYGQAFEIVVEVVHPGGSVVRFQVQPRNLSTTGMGFLHGNFLHKDTECKCFLRAASGNEVAVDAKVVRCEYKSAGVHEIGVQFSAPIDIDNYL